MGVAFVERSVSGLRGFQSVIVGLLVVCAIRGLGRASVEAAQSFGQDAARTLGQAHVEAASTLGKGVPRVFESIGQGRDRTGPPLTSWPSSVGGFFHSEPLGAPFMCVPAVKSSGCPQLLDLWSLTGTSFLAEAGTAAGCTCFAGCAAYKAREDKLTAGMVGALTFIISLKVRKF